MELRGSDALPGAVVLKEGSAAAQLAERCVRCRVQSLEQQGLKVLVLSVARCSFQSQADGGELVQIVEFCTSYDFRKVARVHVGIEEGTEAGSSSPTSGLVAAVVELRPATSGNVVLVFPFIHHYQGPMRHWTLINSRGERVQLYSEPEGQGQVGESPAPISSAKPVPARPKQPPSAAGPPPGVLTSVAMSSELKAFERFWSNMTLQERVCAMSFGGNMRTLAGHCWAAVAELNASARRTTDIGFYAGFSGLILVPALEFLPQPGGRPECPMALMFSTSLAARADLMAVISRIVATHRGGPARLLPATRWLTLFEPLPTSWLHLEAALAFLLEQRCLSLLAAVKGHADEEAKEMQKQAIQEKAVERQQARALQKQQRLLKKAQPPKALEPGPLKSGAIAAAGEASSVTSEEADEEEGPSPRPAQEGGDAAEPSGVPLEPQPDEEWTREEAEEEWQEIMSCRRRTKERKPGPHTALPEAKRPAVPQLPLQKSAPALHSIESGPSISQPSDVETDAEDEDEAQELERIEEVARSWQTSVWASEAMVGSPTAQNTSGGRMTAHWRSRRNENASWRLWFMARRGSDASEKGKMPKPRARKAEARVFGTCPNCAGAGCIGKLCAAPPDPWRPPLPTEQGSMQLSSGTSSEANTRTSGPLHGPEQGEAAADQTAPWRWLLHSPMPASKAARRRYENALWRRWWASHHASEGDKFASMAYFPPTPTSTFPGTPRGFGLDADEPNPSAASFPLAPPQLEAQPPPIVFLPVPVHLAPHVQRYIESLVMLGPAADAHGLLGPPSTPANWFPSTQPPPPLHPVPMAGAM